MPDMGISTSARQDPDDTNAVVEGTAMKRVKIGAGEGPGVDYVTLGGAWYVRVCTGDEGEKFYGLAATPVDMAGSLAIWHKGIRRALPDLDDEGSPVSIEKDDPLTHIGVNIPGTFLVWDPDVHNADELDCYCERPVEVDDPAIRVRIGQT